MIFGVLTTIVNYVSYWLFAHPLGCGTVFSTAVAWVLSVLFAYVTNRRWVFHSEAKGAKAIGKEFRASLAVLNKGFAKSIGKNLDLEVTKYGKNENI